MVANCLTSKNVEGQDTDDGECSSYGQAKTSKNVRGNPPSHRDMGDFPRAHSSRHDPDAQPRG